MSIYLMVAYGADPGFLSACDQTLQIVLRAVPLHHAHLRISLLCSLRHRAGFISATGSPWTQGTHRKTTDILSALATKS
jgi:hypothetical protein